MRWRKKGEVRRGRPPKIRAGENVGVRTGSLCQFIASRDDADALAALAAKMNVARSEILRTGLKVMLERARQLGLLARESHPEDGGVEP